MSPSSMTSQSRMHATSSSHPTASIDEKTCYPPRLHQVMWIFCFLIFMASCSTSSRMSALKSIDYDFHTTHSCHENEHSKSHVYVDLPAPADTNPITITSSKRNNSFFQVDDDDVNDDNADDGADVHETIPRSNLHSKIIEDTVNEENEEKLTSASMQRKKNRRERRKSKVGLKMTDREKQKREEMDRSSEQLIITLNPQQSDEEHLKLMKYLREMQKQEMVIEI